MSNKETSKKSKTEVTYNNKTQSITFRSPSGYSTTFYPNGTTVHQEPTDKGVRVVIRKKES